MSRYMLFLYEDPDAFSELSPDEMQRVIERYEAWSASLAERGRLVGSQKLKDGEGRVLPRGDARVIDGPYSETKEVIGGYFAVEAASYDEAVALAESCPHRDFGTIEIRAFDLCPGQPAAESG